MTVVPLGSPLVPEARDTIHEEHVKFLVGLLIYVGQLRDVAPQYLELLFDEIRLALHRGDVLSEPVYVATDGEVHAILYGLASEHFL